MKSLKQPNTSVILNTDDSKSNGTHWVALMRGSDNRTFFYDSFHRSFQSLSKHWRDKPWIQRYDRFKDQALDSEVCGQLCLAMIYCFNKFGERVFDII